MSLPSINFLYLTAAEIQPRQYFQTQGHYGNVKGQIRVKPRRCMLTTPNQCPYQVSTSYTFRILRYSLSNLFHASRLPDYAPAHPDTMGENNTPTALKGCGVKISNSLNLCILLLMLLRSVYETHLKVILSFAKSCFLCLQVSKTSFSQSLRCVNQSD